MGMKTIARTSPEKATPPVIRKGWPPGQASVGAAGRAARTCTAVAAVTTAGLADARATDAATAARFAGRAARRRLIARRGEHRADRDQGRREGGQRKELQGHGRNLQHWDGL